jgi:hypothetical protein
LRLYAQEEPRAVLVGWDTLDAPTYRHRALEGYQGGRVFDAELLDQLEALPQFVAACGFAYAKAPGYEADDFVAAAVAQEERRGGTAIVASGDRDAFQIYFLCSPQSQKAANLRRDSRVSLTIAHDVWITGLSMAADAQPVTDPTEVAKAMNLLQTRYPEYAAMPMPKPEEIAVYRVLPKVISVLDYSIGFGHSDIVTIEQHRSNIG